MGCLNLPEAENAAETVSIYLILFTVFCYLLRYVRLLGGIYANLTYKPYPIRKNPTYTPRASVTVVIPTVYRNPSELAECIGRISSCGPKEIFIVLLESNVSSCRDLCDSHSFSNVTILGVPKLGKRTQMLRALREVTTELVVFGDDDVFWPEFYLENLIAVFEDPRVGAGGTCQRVRRSNGSLWLPTSFWNILGIGYLERRVFNNLTTNAIDGSISTLSGRSACFRTKILSTPEFFTYFTTDSWRGILLNSDDDKATTRYLFSHGWKIAIQTSVYLETTVEQNSKYIDQCMRWARARFRGNLTVMGKETYWYKIHIWGLYVIYFSQYQCSLLVDAGLFYLLSLSLAPRACETRSLCFAVFGLWLLFTKVVKMIPHFLRHPSDLVWVPVLILFGWYHGFMNWWAIVSLQNVTWGGLNLAALQSKTAEKTEETTPLLPALADVSPSFALQALADWCNHLELEYSEQSRPPLLNHCLRLIAINSKSLRQPL